ncbi:hypothetical protein O3Q51_13990 [Cryomorphaceae bacterium 1068]|nr:hypothetical protein [Cryomorphaceae bacterium 1068]
MEENNLDKYFQEKLAGHTEEPPPAVWEGISSELSKSGFAWNKRYLLLLLLLISIGGAAFIGIRLYDMDSRVAELENKIKTEKSESTSETQEKSTGTSDQNAQKASATNEKNIAGNASEEIREAEQNEKKSNQGKDLVENPQGEDFAKAASTVNRSSDLDRSTSKTDQAAKAGYTFEPTPNPGKSKGDSESFLGINASTPIEPTQSQPNSTGNFEVIPTTSRSHSSLAYNPTLLSSISPFSLVNPEFTGREREIDYFDEPGKDWYLFAYGMANYTHRRVVAQAEGAEAIPNQLDKVENGLITPGAGLQLSRELGKKFRLSIGVEYNQWIQEGSYSAQVVFSDVEVMINTATGSEQFDFGGSVESSFGSTQYNSTSGENPFGIGFETLSPDADPVEFNIQARQQINYLSIPISLEYVYNLYPFTFTAGGGLSVNHILGSSMDYTLEDGSPDLEIAPMKKIEGTYLAFQAGVAVEYGISERMSLRLNPSYRGWMTPIFENEQIRTLPFGVAVRAGLIYRLSD